MHDVSAIVTEEYVDNAVRAVKQDMKVWLMGSILTSALTLALPMVGVVFYLGSISQQLSAAFEVQAEHQALFGVRGERLTKLENSDASMRTWAKTQGYVAPERVQ